MIQTEQDIKRGQVKALSKKLKQTLGFRLRKHSFELKDVLEALTKKGIRTDSFSILIATDTYCTANVTQYKNYKKINPIVWFLFFGMEDQPTFTINFFYKIFFPEVRILQPEKTTKLTIRYDGEYTEYTESPIVDYGTDCLHSNGRGGRLILGRGQKNSPRRIDP
jgi:hypothetical protein